jgi:hypothetical protein
MTDARFRPLVRLFYRRFLDNDLLSPAADAHASLAVLLALVATPGIFNLAWLLFAYSGPFLTPSERLLMALDHKCQFLACSMIVSALVTVLGWDAMAIDARDRLVLGSLPIPDAMVRRAKLTALMLFQGAFAGAVNLVPTLGFPVVWLSLVPIGIPRGLQVVAVHALVSIAAAGFGFCSVVALRNLLLLVCGPRLFRALSGALQFVLILGLVAGFLLLPAYSSDLRARIAQRARTVVFSPPMWFVGAYDQLTTSALYGDPDLTRDATWRMWERQQITRTYRLRMIPGILPEAWTHPSPSFFHEADARRRYVALRPVLSELASLAVLGGAAAAAAALLLSALAHRLWRRRLLEPAVARAHGSWRRPAGLVGWRLATRSGVRAGFSFTLQALCRGQGHRMPIAGAIAAACALTAGSLGRAFGGAVPVTPTPALLAHQFTVLYCLLVGLRIAAAIPAELRANWIMRLHAASVMAGMLAGARRAFAFGVVLPVLALLFPLHAALWGPRVALLHLLAGWVASALLMESLGLGRRAIPFTTPCRGSATAPAVRWALALFGLFFFSRGLAWLEYVSLSHPLASAVWPAVSLIVLPLFRAARPPALAGDAASAFESEEETAFVTLGLFSPTR